MAVAAGRMAGRSRPHLRRTGVRLRCAVAAGVGMRARAGYIYIRGEFVNERKAVMRAIGGSAGWLNGWVGGWVGGWRLQGLVWGGPPGCCPRFVNAAGLQQDHLLTRQARRPLSLPACASPCPPCRRGVRQGLPGQECLRQRI